MTKASIKPFKNWLYEEVNDTFGLTRLMTHPDLEKLKNIKLPQNHIHREKIERLRVFAFKYIESWSTDEHKFMFISPFFSLVDFVSEKYKVFMQRPLSIKYDNNTKITKGLVEFMLAKGIQIPRQPHFFLHEYKPEKRRDNDPLGQLLIAMVAAQKLNQDDKPIYGIYVNGRNWFIVILDDKTYSVSNPFVATDEDIYDLFAVLLYIKEIMEEIYSTP
jgi:hypothetical protein